MVGVVYKATGTRNLDVLRGLLNPERGLPLTGTLMILGVMASAGLPGMAGFISEFLLFRGSIEKFPIATLLSMVGSALTAVYFLLLVNRAFFGRLAVTPADPNSGPLDIRIPALTLIEQLPSLVLAGAVVFIGLWPTSLASITEAATNSMAQLMSTLSVVLPIGVTS